MKKSNKIVTISLLVMMIFSFLFSPLITKAAIVYYGKVNTQEGLSVRQGPGTNYTKIGELAFNTQAELVSGSPVSTYKCSGGWYQIKFNNSTDAYVCGTYLSITSKTSNNGTATNDYEKYLESEGFPSTYWDYLSELHAKHPTWNFEAIQTNLDWSTSVAAESIVGNSLIQTSNDGWKSTAAGSYDPNTGKFKVLEGSNWYAAAPGVVAYYIDPRNFLDEKHVFMFEKLSFDASYQTEDAIRNAFSGGNMGNYAGTILNAGQTYGINPVYLASRIRQEVGINIGDSKATTGQEFIYDNKTYSGLYNVYNIGATTGANAVLRGLVWANGGSEGTATSYQRAWKSMEASIRGGAEYIASSYINKGQYTTYLQRFNVDPNSAYKPNSRRYMTNIKAPFSESVSTYDAYASMNLLNCSFKFAIPVYKNMPAATELPNPQLDTSTLPKPTTPSTGNEGSNTPVQIDPNTLINTIGLKTDGSIITGGYEGMEINLIVSSLKSHGATVSTSSYGNIATGDKIKINGKQYTIILYGDLNKDASIGLADLVQLKKYILGYNNLDSTKQKAADVNKDGKVSLADLVMMKKKILRLTNIDQ